LSTTTINDNTRENIVPPLAAVGCDALDAKLLAALEKSLGAFFTDPDQSLRRLAPV